ncbi:MAG: glycoside hydrolase family 3 N-terminal domain-containing protein [Pseudomonadota bacterium]
MNVISLGRRLRMRSAFVGVAMAMVCANGAAQQSDYFDPTLSPETRAADLLQQMTLEEKIAQLSCVWMQKSTFLDEDGNYAIDKMRRAFPHGVGCVARPQDRVGLGEPGEIAARDATETVALVNAIQRYMIEETRLKLPVLFHEEGLHGFQGRDATVFPQSIALASTWDPELVEQVYAITAREIRARGVHHVLSPVVDVARDPRWGRIEETYGEDPYLVSRMGVAAVRGFQGRQFPIGPDRVLTTLKHMTGHGEPEAGMNVGPAHVSERTLREIFFPPFEAAIKEGGAASVMASYNEIDGVPSHASEFLLQQVLRDEWGFDGLVVSDYFAIDELESRHAVVGNLGEAAITALRTGVDLETPDPSAYPLLLQAVRSGALDEAVIDRSVRNVLIAKFRGGVLESPYADAAAAEAITGNAEARALALDAARKAIVLLKNEDSVLPLDRSALKRIAVIGPNANETILGGYSDVPRQTVSVLDGIRAAAGDDIRVDYAEGARITEGRSWWKDEVTFVEPADNAKRIKKAVRLARKADVIVAVIGGNESTSREAWGEQHLGDRISLQPVGEQTELVEALVNTGKPVVLVLINGRPLAVTELSQSVPSVIEGWILGQETGTAMAEVLFGEYNPGGKLPVTIPRSVGHLPAYYNHKPTARRGYVDDSAGPLFAFGYGLSYTEFAFDEPRVDSPQITWGSDINVHVRVTNVGERVGDETLQLYIRDAVSSVTRPVKELKAFQRITLAPGASRDVTLTVPFNALSFIGPDMLSVVEPGEFELMIGPSSDDVQSVFVELQAAE